MYTIYLHTMLLPNRLSIKLEPTALTPFPIGILKFKHINETFGPSTPSSQFKTRSSAIETMERLLVAWIENCNQQNIRIDTPTIQAKAKDFFQKIKNEQEFCDMTQTELKESFDASKGWFYRFKKRTGIVLHRSLDEQSGIVSKKTFAPIKE